MTITFDAKKEIFFMAYSAWGHCRPMCSLAALIVQEPNHHVTFACIPFLFDKVLKELASHFPDKSPEEIQELITVIAVTDNNAEFIAYFNDEYHAAVNEALGSLSIKCGKTGKVYTIPVPSIMVGDILDYEVMSIARKSLPKEVKYVVSFPGSAYSALRTFGPEKYGGFGDLEVKAFAETERSGADLLSACNAVWFHRDESVINLPGLPPFFDYEIDPQASYFPQFAIIFLHCHRLLNECDAVMLMSNTTFEPDAIHTLKQWFAETERPLFTIGPLLPLKHFKDGHNDLVTGSSMGEKKEILDFLDTTLEKHGKKSLIYISFGTVYWPTMPEMIYSLIDELIAAGVPFIFTHASSLSQGMPAEVKEKVNASGLGLLTTWSPQKNVLAHPVTGWFVSHCGQNSTLEALAYGVPIIAWPFEYDQPLIAVLVSLVHEIGYELLQVRSGEMGFKKPYRCASEDETPKGEEAAWRAEMRAVLAKARGDDGEKKRANVLKMRERIIESWQEGGDALNGFHTFLNVAGGNHQ